MNQLGVIEGFFGPAWPIKQRKSYAEFLREHGGNFYIYAPKQDPFLRKKWRETWDDNYQDFLKDLADHFHKSGIQFGVGFSPFGLGESLSLDDQKHLKDKLTTLVDLGIDMLGLFFDDMPTNENLAETQIEAYQVVKKFFNKKIVFCPSYYTPDPLLDRVFGQRPENYLEKIAAGIPDASLAWTGPKVISPEISAEHLREVSLVLKRKPFLWENFFANDGPKNCKFLKLKPFAGRTHETFEASEAFGLNMMNQPELSKITYLGSKYVMDGLDSEEAFEKAFQTLCSKEFQHILREHRDDFLSKGLDQLSQDEKNHLLNSLKLLSDPAAREIEDWLNGVYLVGTECLTD